MMWMLSVTLVSQPISDIGRERGNETKKVPGKTLSDFLSLIILLF